MKPKKETLGNQKQQNSSERVQRLASLTISQVAGSLCLWPGQGKHSAWLISTPETVQWASSHAQGHQPSSQCLDLGAWGTFS